MAVDLRTIKALTFDVGGTIFDWHHTIREEVERLAHAWGVEIDCASFTNNWRWRMFELLGQVRSGDLPWMNARTWSLRCVAAKGWLCVTGFSGVSSPHFVPVSRHGFFLRCQPVAWSLL